MNGIETLLVSGIIGGTALIPFVDLVTKDVKNPKVVYLIALVSSVVIGAFIALAEGKISLTALKDPNMVLVSISTVFVSSQTIFKLYWEGSLLRETVTQRTPPENSTPLAETGDEPIQPV